jgi:proteic killer suppression protein
VDQISGFQATRSPNSRINACDWQQAEKRLRILEAAANLRDLAQLRSNRLEALAGDREGQYSIRINQQWRICFEWTQGADGPENVEIADYQ